MTDRHDADLHAAVRALLEDSPPPPPFERASSVRPRRRPVRRWLAASAAATALGVVVVALATRGPDRTHTVVATDSTTMTAATTAAAPQATCGTQPPGELWAPAGYTGPQPGPASEADAQPTVGQLVAHWSGASGSIEVRWPPDPTLPDLGFRRPLTVMTDGPPRISSGAGFGPRPATGSTSRHDTIYVVEGAVPEEACRFLQITVLDSDPTRLDATVEWLRRSPFRPTEPLVAARQTADAPPLIGRCRAPAGVTAPPNKQSSGDGATFNSPDSALEHLVEVHRTVLLRGYVQFKLPDGTFAYGAEVSGQWVTVVYVAPTTGGWTVTRYETTGC